MKPATRLVGIKFLHTLVWAVMAMASLYVLYAGVTGDISFWVWIAIGLLSAESLLLGANRWTCPLTPLAGRYTLDRRDNFDIYLPLLVARYNKQIFGSMFAAGFLLVLVRQWFR